MDKCPCLGHFWKSYPNGSPDVFELRPINQSLLGKPPTFYQSQEHFQLGSPLYYSDDRATITIYTLSQSMLNVNNTTRVRFSSDNIYVYAELVL